MNATAHVDSIDKLRALAKAKNYTKTDDVQFDDLCQIGLYPPAADRGPALDEHAEREAWDRLRGIARFAGLLTDPVPPIDDSAVTKLGFTVERVCRPDTHTAYILRGARSEYHLKRQPNRPDVLFAVKFSGKQIVASVRGYTRFIEKDGALRPLA